MVSSYEPMKTAVFLYHLPALPMHDHYWAEVTAFDVWDALSWCNTH